jgi:hypothetical protein
MGWDWLLTFMPYGDTWRRHRRAIHQHFHPDAATRYEPVQLRHTRYVFYLYLLKGIRIYWIIGNYFDNYMRPLINSLSMSGILPAQSSWKYVQPVESLFRFFAGYSTLQVVYGIKVLASQDPYIDTAEKALASLGVAGNPGSFLVDVIPMRASHAPLHHVRVSPDCCS